MQIYFSITDNVLIARISGDIDHHSAGNVRYEIDETYMKDGCRHMILDFSRVTFMDSSGIGVVLGRYNVVTENKGEIVICECTDYVRSILYMSGVFTIIKECDFVEKALEYLGEKYQENYLNPGGRPDEDIESHEKGGVNND